MGGWPSTICPICSPTPQRPLVGFGFNGLHKLTATILSIPFILLISRTTAHFQTSFVVSLWSKLVRGDQLSPEETHANACQLSSEHLVALARLVPPPRTRAACAEGLVIATLASPESLSAYRRARSLRCGQYPRCCCGSLPHLFDSGQYRTAPTFPRLISLWVVENLRLPPEGRWIEACSYRSRCCRDPGRNPPFVLKTLNLAQHPIDHCSRQAGYDP